MLRIRLGRNESESSSFGIRPKYFEIKPQIGCVLSLRQPHLLVATCSSINIKCLSYVVCLTTVVNETQCALTCATRSSLFSPPVLLLLLLLLLQLGLRLEQVRFRCGVVGIVLEGELVARYCAFVVAYEEP
jgi:hypothetical protein